MDAQCQVSAPTPDYTSRSRPPRIHVPRRLISHSPVFWPWQLPTLAQHRTKRGIDHSPEQPQTPCLPPALLGANLKTTRVVGPEVRKDFYHAFHCDTSVPKASRFSRLDEFATRAVCIRARLAMLDWASRRFNCSAWNLLRY